MRQLLTALAVCACGSLPASWIGAPTAWAASGDHGAVVSINGETKTTKHPVTGTTADSGFLGSGNKAIAVNGGDAFANSGTGNRAIAVNSGSNAIAGQGADNTAMAINGGTASALESDNNTSRAINNSVALTGSPMENNNTAMATGGGAAAAVLGDQTVICHASRCQVK